MERNRRTDDGTYPNAGEELEKYNQRGTTTGRMQTAHENLSNSPKADWTPPEDKPLEGVKSTKKYVAKHKKCDLYIVERRGSAARWDAKKDAMKLTKAEWELELSPNVRHLIVLEEIDLDVQIPLPSEYPVPPNLSLAQIERLAVVMEECGELIQAAGKILRHGYDSKYAGVDNRGSLTREAGDIIAAINMLVVSGDIDSADLAEAVKDKERRIKHYLHHQEDEHVQDRVRDGA